MRILFLGRFQPFHNGHLEVVKYLTKMGEVLIAVGSAQCLGTFKNPFAYKEREMMIRASLEEVQLEIIDIVPIKDIYNHARWAEHVKATAPQYDAVFTNSSTDRHIFEFAGERVMKEWLFQREKFEGKKVREAMAADKGWKELVPPGAAKVLEEIGGIQRLKILKEKGPSGEDA